MDFEQRLRDALHEVADGDLPDGLLERSLDRVRGKASRRSRIQGLPIRALAAGLAALAAVTLVVAMLLNQQDVPPGQTPGPAPAGTPSPSPAGSPVASPAQTPPPCPAALIEGTLYRLPAGGIGILEAGGAPGPATPAVSEIIWEPYFFAIVEQDGQPAVGDPAGQVLARVGDVVRLGGGQAGDGWYACGEIEVLDPIGPTGGPVVDVNDGTAWRTLAAIEAGLPGRRVGNVRRLEWVGEVLHLEFRTTMPNALDGVAAARGALAQARLSGTVATSTADPGYVAVEITDGRQALMVPTQVRCGTWWRFEVRAAGDGGNLTPEQLATVSLLLRYRLQQLSTSAEVVAFNTPDRVVLEWSRLEPDAAAADIVRRSLAAPVPIEFMAAPPGAPAVPIRGSPAGLEPLFGGAGVAQAGPEVDQAGFPALVLELDPAAAVVLDDFAAGNQGGQVALVAEGMVVIAATINAPSFSGRVRVIGDHELGLLLYLADRLRLGIDTLELELIDDSIVERDC